MSQHLTDILPYNVWNTVDITKMVILSMAALVGAVTAERLPEGDWEE